MEGQKIKHNVYKDGKVQSLGFVDGCGNRYTIGVMLPGERYEFNTTDEETITVTSGIFRASLPMNKGDEWKVCPEKLHGEESVVVTNNVAYRVFTLCDGDTWTIPPNTTFFIGALNGAATYICSYRQIP